MFLSTIIHVLLPPSVVITYNFSKTGHYVTLNRLKIYTAPNKQNICKQPSSGTIENTKNCMHRNKHHQRSARYRIVKKLALYISGRKTGNWSACWSAPHWFLPLASRTDSSTVCSSRFTGILRQVV